MNSGLRFIIALVLPAVLILPFGIAPSYAGLTQALPSFLAPFGSLADRADSFERDQVLEELGLVAAPHRSFSQIASGPVEVMISLEGNSLAAEQARRVSVGLSPLDAEAQRAYTASLRAVQAPLVSTLAANGANVLYTYQIAFNGVAAVIDSGQLVELYGMPRVGSVHQSLIFTPALDNSVPFIFGGKTNTELGVDGSGVSIAIIDTGIDYTHASLGGSGIPADFFLNDPTFIEPGTFPNAKVVGGRDLVGEFYDPACPPIPAPGVCSSIPFPDPDPLDQVFHGTHVASIAAGLPTAFVSPGAAPGADLFAFKIFALGGATSAVVVAGIEAALDPNGDGDTSDAVDVINMSLGSPYGRDTESTAVASNAAVDLGVIVVASAGNAGDLPYVTGAPAAASKAISVAAGQDPGIEAQLVTVSDSAGGAADGDFESLPAAFGPSLSTTGTKAGVTEFVGLACSPLAGSLAGKIALIIRGACNFTVKVKNAQDAGAISAVVFNDRAGAGPIIMGGTDPTIIIPSVMVGNLDGIAIRDNIVPGTTTITLDPANVLPVPNRLAGFTSRGPRFVDSALKPDITAPGTSVAAALIGSGTGAVDVSGTSMSSPHIAGSAALLRELHPTWSVEEIKAVLMNTATDASPNGLPYPVSLMGSGIVQVDVAVETESVVVPASASFGVEERASKGKKTFSVELEIRNFGDEDKKFKLTSDFLFPSDDEGSIQIKHPRHIKVDAGESEDFKLRLKVNFDKLAPESIFEEYDGFLTLTEITKDDGGDVLRVPFHIVPYARAEGEVDEDELELPDDDELELENDGIRDTLVDIYQFGVFDPNEDLIFEAPGAPKDPDDWFDIRHTGAHAFDVFFGRIIEFAMTTHASRSVANFMDTRVFIDIDGGGPDYFALAIDFGVFGDGAPFPNGNIVTAICEVTTALCLLEFFTGNDPNTAIQTIPFVVEDLNFLAFLLELFFGLSLPTLDPADPDFDYFAATFDFETGSFDVTDSASFNWVSPEIDTDPNFLLLSAGDEVEVDVLASVEGGILVLFYNNISGRDQSQVVDIEFDDDDDDDDDDEDEEDDD